MNASVNVCDSRTYNIAKIALCAIGFCCYHAKCTIALLAQLLMLF